MYLYLSTLPNTYSFDFYDVASIRVNPARIWARLASIWVNPACICVKLASIRVNPACICAKLATIRLLLIQTYGNIVYLARILRFKPRFRPIIGGLFTESLIVGPKCLDFIKSEKNKRPSKFSTAVYFNNLYFSYELECFHLAVQGIVPLLIPLIQSRIGSHRLQQLYQVLTP